MSGLRRVLGRLGFSVVVIVSVVTLTFLVNHALPGDPARVVTGPQARPADVERVRRQLGLDRPLWVQYGLFARRLVHVGPREISRKDPAHESCSSVGLSLHVDLGMSYQQRKPVTVLVAERLPATVLLAVSALLVQVGLGVFAGAVAARRRGSLVSEGIVLVTLLGISVPTFLIALGLQVLFAYRLRVLPFDGMAHGGVVLPALTLGLWGAAYYTRLVRDEVLNQEAEQYVRTALAKGATRTRVLVVHVLRNTLLPLITVVGLDFGALIGGAIVTEKIFRWPGMGSLSVDAVVSRDGPVVMGTVIVASTAIVLANLAVDASYALLDPRVRRA